MTWDIPIRRVITRLRQLPERKMLGEFHFFINTYFHSLLNFSFASCKFASLQVVKQSDYSSFYTYPYPGPW